MTEDPGTGQSPRRERRPDESAWVASDPATDAPADAAAPAGPRSDPWPNDPDPTAASWLSRLDQRSLDPATCLFLRSVDDEGELAAAVAAPDAINRCAALREAVPQSLRQQELVCLTSGHVNCPRYLRGTLDARDRPRRRPGRGTWRPLSGGTPTWPVEALARWRSRGPKKAGAAGEARPRTTALTPAILAASLFLLASFSGSIAYVVANGGLTMPVAAVDPSASPSDVAVAPSPSAPPAATATPAPRPTATPMPTPTPTPSPSPTPSPTPPPTPTPTPRATAKPTPTGDPILARFPELRRCANRSDCYVYVVEPGNNLYSIANYYRVSYDRVLAMNPKITNPANIHTGDPIRLPTPQRPAP